MKRIHLLILYLSIAFQPLAAIDKVDGYYQIHTADDLAAFAQLVNGGEVTACARLLADIDFSHHTEMIGTGKKLGMAINPFRGIFDGNFHTVTLGYDTKNSFTALFSFVDGATIKNLYVDGMVKSRTIHVAGVAAHVTGNSKFSNVISSVNLICIEKKWHIGGGGIASVIVAGNATFDNCGFCGSIYSDIGDEFGGIIGWIDCWNSSASAVLNNCFVSATFHCSTTASSTFAASDYAKITINNCYYLNPLGKEQGIRMSVRQFADGTVCWLLNKDNIRHPVWFQTIGTDAVPHPFEDGHKQVYARKLNCAGYPVAGEQLTNSADGASFVIPTHSYDGYMCSVCHAINPTYCKQVDGYYEIGTADQLSWFASMVGSGMPDINGRLTADIDFTGHSEMIGIGSGKYPDPGYQGVFDGGGHDIKISYTSDKDNTALFRYINGAKIMNLSTSGTISVKSRIAGGVAGAGSGTFINVLSTVTINCIGNVEGLYGGLFSCVTTGNTVFVNCGFAGSFVGSESYYYGGFVGQPNGYKVDFTNCYVDVQKNTFTAPSGAFTMVFYPENYRFINCYHNSVFGISQGNQVTDEQFRNGEICRDLNRGGTNVWKQEVGTDAFPKPFNIQEMQLVDDKYQITTAEDLEQFARMVNSGHTAAGAVLLSDINYQGRRDLIGTETNPYHGTFDGASHKITVDIDDDETYLGLFRFVGRGGTIKDLHVDGTIHAHGQYTGGIAGHLADGSINNCLSTVEIRSDHMEDSYYGGICGFASGRSSIQNSVYMGQVNVLGGEGVFGLIGWVSSRGTSIRNSLSVLNSYTGFAGRTGSVYGSPKPGYATLDNVYYLSDDASTVDGAEKITMEKIRNGEVFYSLLGGAIRIAEQTIDSQQVKIKKNNFWIGASVVAIIIVILILIAVTLYFQSQQFRLRRLYEEALRQHADWEAQLHQRVQQALSVEKEVVVEEVAPPAEADHQTTIATTEHSKNPQFQELYRRLINTMEEQRLYMRPDLDETMLAQELGTNVNYLSRCINQMAGNKNFSTWLNAYRVNYAIQLIEVDHETSINTLTEQSGFSSHNTFNRHFKNITGMTASQYIKVKK